MSRAQTVIIYMVIAAASAAINRNTDINVLLSKDDRLFQAIKDICLQTSSVGAKAQDMHVFEGRVCTATES